MANMYPTEMEESARKSNPAEAVVFGALQCQLGGDFPVVWSFQWSEGHRIGEADFVVTREDWSYFLVMEVKGGRVNFRNNEWCRVSRGRNEPIRPSPIYQARNSVGAIGRRVNAAHGSRAQGAIAVVLPDVQDLNAGQNLDGLPPNCLIDANGLAAINDDSVHAIGTTAGGVEDRQAWQNILAVICPPATFAFTLSGRIHQERETWKRLTEQQLTILNFLGEDQRQMVFSGVAGSGKTILAMEAARRRAEAGSDSLYLCHNRPLAAAVYQQLRSVEGLSAYPLEAVPPGRDWDAVFVDEAQDFPAEYWHKICGLQRPTSTDAFWFFHDPGQKRHPNNVSIADMAPNKGWTKSAHLDLNIRNTKEIATFISKFAATSSMADSPHAPQGAKVDSTRVWTPDELVCAIARRVNGWIKAGVKENQIAVLEVDDEEQCMRGVKSAIKYRLCRSPHRLLANIHTDEVRGRHGGKQIPIADYLTPVYSSASRFKGLEAAAVVVVAPVEVDLFERDNMIRKMYMASSRAQHRLAIIEAPVDYTYLCKLFWEQYVSIHSSDNLQDTEFRTQGWREKCFCCDGVLLFLSLGVNSSGVHVFIRGRIDGNNDQGVREFVREHFEDMTVALDWEVPLVSDAGPRFFLRSKQFNMQRREERCEAIAWLSEQYKKYVDALKLICENLRDATQEECGVLDPGQREARRALLGLCWASHEEINQRFRDKKWGHVAKPALERELREMVLDGQPRMPRNGRNGVKCKKVMTAIRTRASAKEKAMNDMFSDIYRGLSATTLQDLIVPMVYEATKRLNVGALEPFWMRRLLDYLHYRLYSSEGSN